MPKSTRSIWKCSLPSISSVADAAAGDEQVFGADGREPRIDQRQGRSPVKIDGHAPPASTTSVIVCQRVKPLTRATSSSAGGVDADAVAGVDHDRHQRGQRQEHHLGDIAEPEPDGDQRDPGEQRDLLEGVEARAERCGWPAATAPAARPSTRPQAVPIVKPVSSRARLAANRPPELAAARRAVRTVSTTSAGDTSSGRVHDPVEAAGQRPQRDDADRQHQAAPARASARGPCRLVVRRPRSSGRPDRGARRSCCELAPSAPA